MVDVLRVVASVMPAAGSVRVTVSDSVHPFSSVTVTVYVPATKPVAVAVVCPSLQEYVYAPVPPEGVAVAVPSLPPLQLMLNPPEMEVDMDVATDSATGGSVRVTSTVAVQLLASRTTTVYTPAIRLLMFAVLPTAVPPRVQL